MKIDELFEMTLESELVWHKNLISNNENVITVSKSSFAETLKFLESVKTLIEQYEEINNEIK